MMRHTEKTVVQVSLRRALATMAALVLISCSGNAPENEATRSPSPENVSQGPSEPSGHGTVVGQAPAARNGARSVVVLQSTNAEHVPAPAATAVMDQVQMTFVPDLLIARTGYPVEFRNSDEEMHNMNVRETETRQQAFNAAVPPGAAYQYTFEKDGFFIVTCDVHPAMSAAILVTSTPFNAVADADGHFEFQHVPPGEYVLSVYAGVERFDKTIRVAGGRTDVRIGTE